MLSRKKICEILKQVHPDTGIEKEATIWLHVILEESFNMSSQELLDSLPGELGKHAVKEFTKLPKAESIIDYLLAEILELSGNCARDHERARISPFHLWMAIENDEELLQVFKSYTPILPLKVQKSSDNDIIHGKSGLTKASVRGALKDKEINLRPDEFNIILNILTQASNHYLHDKDIIGKLESMGCISDGTLPNRTLQKTLLDVLIDKFCQNSEDGNISFTKFNTIVKDCGDIFDFL